MKTCPECNETIVGRTDKIYCSDSCRNNCNNQKKQQSKELTIISAILKKNRQILEELISQGTKKATKEKLLQQGFNFYYFTNIDTVKGITCHFCFEYGYLQLEENYFKLIKR